VAGNLLLRGDMSWTIRSLVLTTVVGSALSWPAAAQEPSTPPQSPEWSANVSAGWYMLPDALDYAQPTIRIDRSWLHLESRYAYEDRHSLSLFAGVNIEVGDDVTFTMTPMMGGLFGDVSGIVPAIELDFSVWRFDAYGEAEYVFDVNDSSSNFFYMWSELSLRPVEWARAGLVTQRARISRTERDVQHGPLVGVTFSKVEATFYLFNPGADDQYSVFLVGVSF
jgi:hypothetical protein